MKIAVILNGTKSKKSRWFQHYHSVLSTQHELEIFETKSAGDGIAQTIKAIDQNPDVVLAAGGDGTLNQVVNGLMQKNSKIPVAIAPLGSGNDFAAICGIKNQDDLLRKLTTEPVETDLGVINGFSIDGRPEKRFFINVSSIGLGPDVAHLIENSSRRLGADLTYILNTVRGFLRQVPVEIIVQTDSVEWKGKIRVLAVANGVRFGSGIHIAPGAKVDDGLFATFVAGDVPLHEFLYLLMKIKGGVTVNHQQIQYGTAKSVRLAGPSGTWLEADGELTCLLPAELTVLPSAIKVFR